MPHNVSRESVTTSATRGDRKGKEEKRVVLFKSGRAIYLYTPLAFLLNHPNLVSHATGVVRAMPAEGDTPSNFLLTFRATSAWVCSFGAGATWSVVGDK